MRKQKQLSGLFALASRLRAVDRVALEFYHVALLDGEKMLSGHRAKERHLKRAELVSYTSQCRQNKQLAVHHP